MRILFCSTAFPGAREILRTHLPADTLDVVPDGRRIPDAGAADVLVPLMSRVDEAAMTASACRLVQQFGSGLEGVDLDAARRRRIWVANVPSTGSNADSVAEHALFLALAVLRRIDECRTNIQRGILGAPCGTMLAGRTVCLYGLGAIASAAARRLQAFDVRLIGVTREPSPAKAAAFGLEAIYATAEVASAFARTDVLLVCARLSEATRGAIDARALGALPRGAVLINTARAGLVDRDALGEALVEGRLGGAGLDVFWEEPPSPADPLLALPNVVATPHVAGVTDRSYAEIAASVVANIERLRRGEPPAHRAA
jgi:phosphoglycerate dehydrogenase-like enzyme